MSKEIPSHVKPSIEALQKEVADANRWMRDTEDTINTLEKKVEDLYRQIKLQNQHLDNYKMIAFNRENSINELVHKHGLVKVDYVVPKPTCPLCKSSHATYYGCDMNECTNCGKHYVIK